MGGYQRTRLDEGGQGRVFLVKDIEKTGNTEQRLEEIRKSIISLAAVGQTHQVSIDMAKLLAEAVSHIAPKAIDPSAVGALKILHKPKEDAAYEKAKARLKQEVEILNRINHPNILKILDHEVDQNWFVGEYHPGGTLWRHKELFKGDLVQRLGHWSKALLKYIKQVVCTETLKHITSLLRRTAGWY